MNKKKNNTTKSDALRLAVIVGSTREARFSEKPAEWIYSEARKLKGVDAQLLDLREYTLPFFNEPISPAMVEPGSYGTADIRKWVRKVKEADAYIIVTPEYNHGYPAVLKNALDHAYYEWNNKPVAFVSYGGVAGARSVEQLRLVAIELQMMPIRNAVHIPEFWNLLDETGRFKADVLKETAEKMFEQLLWWARILRTAREAR